MSENPKASLRTKVRRGVAWSALDTALNRSGQFAMGLVVARLVAPRVFGIYAVALIVHSILIGVSDMGLGSALIQGGDEELDNNAPTVMSIALLTGLVLGGLMALSAPMLAGLVGVPASTETIRIMAIALPLAGISSVPSALLFRGFRMDRMFIADTANTFIGGGIVIPLVLIGLGPVALALSFVAGQLITTVLVTVYSPRRYWPGWNRHRAGGLLRFGMPLAGANVLTNLVRNVDYVIVGRLLGPVELGYYTLAFNMSGWPQNLIGQVVKQVSLPAFSRMREDGRDMGRAFCKMLNQVARLTLPVCLFMGALAHPLIVLVYGQKWAPAAAALVGLSIMGVARTLTWLFSDFLISFGSTASQMIIQIVWLLPLIGMLIWFVNLWGIAGAGAAQAVVTSLVVLPAYAYATSRFGVRWGMLLRALLPLSAWATLCAAITWFIGQRLEATPLLAILAGGATGLAIYLIPFHRDLVKLISAVRARARPSRSTTPAASPVDAVS